MKGAGVIGNSKRGGGWRFSTGNSRCRLKAPNQKNLLQLYATISSNTFIVVLDICEWLPLFLISGLTAHTILLTVPCLLKDFLVVSLCSLSLVTWVPLRF